MEERKRRGGNRKPQTFKKCERCGVTFGPLDRLSQKFCSMECKVSAQTTGRKRVTVAITKARSAQSLLRYHVLKGHIVRAKTCEQCGVEGVKIEAAHHDYRKPLDVQWLCVSCHRKLDKRNAKHGTRSVIVTRWENATGKKAVLSA